MTFLVRMRSAAPPLLTHDGGDARDSSDLYVTASSACRTHTSTATFSRLVTYASDGGFFSGERPRRHSRTSSSRSRRACRESRPGRATPWDRRRYRPCRPSSRGGPRTRSRTCGARRTPTTRPRRGGSSGAPPRRPARRGSGHGPEPSCADGVGGRARSREWRARRSAWLPHGSMCAFWSRELRRRAARRGYVRLPEWIAKRRSVKHQADDQRPRRIPALPASLLDPPGSGRVGQ